MSSSQTPILQLFKATPGTAETWRTSDVNSNWDKVDAVMDGKSVDVSPSTIANSTTETTMFSGFVKIALQGTVCRLIMAGTFGHSATSTTLTIRVKLGGTTLITHVITTPASALSARPFRHEAELFCMTSGPTGTWKPSSLLTARVNATDTPFVESPAAVTKDTTLTQNLDVTFQWGAANAANTATLDAGFVHRITNS